MPSPSPTPLPPGARKKVIRLHPPGARENFPLINRKKMILKRLPRHFVPRNDVKIFLPYVLYSFFFSPSVFLYGRGGE